MEPSHTAESHSSWTKDLLLLVLVFGALFFFRLGDYALANPDEGRYAEIPREMLASGDWVLPHLNDVVYFEKPPLVYWATATAFKLFGQNEWAARSVPALFALLGVLSTYAAGRALVGRLAALFAALALGSSLLFFALARILILDMAVSVFISTTLFCFILGVREAPGPRRRLLFYGLYASAALATLSKGLIGVALPGAVMFFWLLLFNQWKRLLPFYLPTGALLFLLIAAPWHVLAAQRHPEWAWFYFVHEHWMRFTTTTHDRYEPIWYFAVVLPLGFLPWTGYLFTGLRSFLPGAWSRRRELADQWFLVLWAVFIFLFFSKSQSKLAPYILPVYPPLALFVGGVMAKALVDRERARLSTGFYSSLAFFGVLGLVSLAGAARPSLLGKGEELLALRPVLGLLGLLLVGGCLWTLRIARRGRVLPILVAQFGLVSALYLCLTGAYPLLHKRSSRDVAAEFTQKVQPGDRLFHWHTFAHDFVFYSGHFTGLVGTIDELELKIDPEARASGRFVDDKDFAKIWAGETRVWLVLRGARVEEFAQSTGLQYHLIATGKRYTLLSNRP